MRAYLAVIKDSFREAFSSKILWVLIVMIALFLALLAGLSVAPAERTGLDFPDVFDWPELATRLRAAEADSPAGQLRGRFPADLQSDLRGFQHDGENRRVFRDLRRQLNEQLTTDDFATAIVVPEEKLSEEARELSGRGEGVDEKTRQRLNRLILEAALGIQQKHSDKKTILITKDVNLRILADAEGLAAEEKGGEAEQVVGARAPAVECDEGRKRAVAVRNACE